MAKFTVLNLVAALALVILGGLLLGLPAVVGAQGPEIQGDVGAQATVGTAFTYQGHLVKSGSAVNDTCNFRFALYDDPTSGSPVGNSQTVNNVTVSDGNFVVELNGNNEFGSSAFTGDARYLEIEVQCSGDSGFVSLNTGTPKRVATYSWSPEPDSGQGTSQTAYTWDTAGDQSISVGVSNCSGVGATVDNHMVAISASAGGNEHKVYLPITVKNYAE